MQKLSDIKKNFPEWYQDIVEASGLAEHSPTPGCIVIKPYGYALWENIQQIMNKKIKEVGAQNAYFPLLIPESFFKKEAKHAQGFSPEVAWIDKELTKDGERLAIRPTSETIIYDSYSRWIRSYRDLPLKINQWCNIVRWEVKDVKLFLRSREFLWQEGHCVYETREECDKETYFILDEYQKLSHELLAIPVIKGKKTEKEKFAGAQFTTTIESLMPDGKALQMGTSHTLSQGFAKSFGIQFLGKDEKMHHPWQNSWGISTRLIGAVILMHGDDKGLVLPPMIAPIHIVIVPIFFDKNKEKVLTEAKSLYEKLSTNFSVKLDIREEYSPGWKFNEWELKGVPIRLELGPRDIDAKQVVLVRRDNGKKEFVPLDVIENKISSTLASMQSDLFEKAKLSIENNTAKVASMKELILAIENGKWAIANFCGDENCEKQMKEETGGITSRCIPLGKEEANGNCVHCNNPGKCSVYFAKNY